MKAVGYRMPGGLEREDALVDIILDTPRAQGLDLLVEVKAISVNPVDVKLRATMAPTREEWQVLGWDAAGIVREVGDDAEGFSPGDEVFYAGALDRPGTNAEFHLVDARIVAHKPKCVDFTDAAALPLTAITAWEALFDRLNVKKPVPGVAPAIVIVGGAGGVGSIAIQLARACSNLIVIATASRPETMEWVLDLGAHYVIDHSKPLAQEVAKLGLKVPPSFVLSTTHTDQHLSEIAEFIAPQGRFALIDNVAGLDFNPFMRKSVSIHWELMFTRSIFQTPDIAEQGRLLRDVSSLVDEGKVRSTRTETFWPINAATLKHVHALIESNRTRGKIVIEGFPS